MNSYAYTATDADGNQLQGVVNASDLSTAVAQLSLQNLTVVAIALRDPTVVAQERQSQVFEDNLRVLLERRDEWLAALTALDQELPPGPTRRVLQSLSRQFRSPQFEHAVPSLLQRSELLQLLPLLKVPDATDAGQMPLRTWLAAALQQQQLKSQQRKRLIYPIWLVGLSLLIMSGFSMFMVPIFRDMYADFGLTLPAPTKLVFWIAEQVSTYLVRSLVMAACLALFCVPLVRYWRSRAWTNRLLGRWVAGTTTNLRAMANLISTLAQTLSLGASPSEALRLAGSGSRNLFYQRAAVDLAGQFENSAEVTPQLSSAVLPPSLVMAMQADSAGKPCLPMLHALAQMYSERAQSRVELLTTMLPIAAVVVVGMGVGLVIIALFMPLVSMITSLA